MKRRPFSRVAARPDPEALEEAAKLLGGAQHPLLVTASGGRTLDSARAIEQLAQMLAVPVVHYRPRHLALSTEHLMHCGWDPHLLLKADVVLVVDCDVPIPKEGKPKAEAKVIHIGPDPLFARIRCAASAPTSRSRARSRPRCRRSGAPPRSRPSRSSASRSAARRFRSSPTTSEGKESGGRSDAGEHHRKVALRVRQQVLDDNTILVNEYPTVLEEMVIREPGRYFGNPSAGGLGWGMGAALGAKLASPDKTVICAVGDGAYMFGNPTAAHYVSEAMRLPVLFVIANNARWAAVHRSTLSDLPQGFAAAEKEAAVRHARALAALRACAGERRPRRAREPSPKQLMPALERAQRLSRKKSARRC